MGVSVEAQVLKDGLIKYFIDDEFSSAYKDLQESFSLKKAFVLIWEGVEMVERLANDAQMVSAGSKKREALVSWLDDAIKFTGILALLEVADGKLIGAVVDGCIAFLNGKFGNDWAVKWSKYV